MKNILNIFKTDINNIRKKRAAIVVIVALMILPSMYAWFNILPSWDPYSNTEDVAIAVVNNDEGTTVEGESLNVGDEVILSLLDNKSMGWQFVDEEEASEGVEKGDYYASIVIPKDFSKKLASVLDDEPEKPELDYYINEKINAIAPKVTSKGASGIVESIESGFIKVTNEAIFTAFNDIGVEIETNRLSIENLRDAIYELEENLPEIEMLLSTADQDLEKVEESVGKANDGVKRAEDISRDAERMSERLEDMLDESDKTVREYVPLVKQDLRIAQIVIQEVPSITRRISQKGADVDQLLNTIEDSTTKIDDSREALQSLVELLESADDRLTGDRDFEKLIDRMNEEYERVDELREKLEKVTRALATGDHIGTDIVTDINNMAKEMEKELHRIVELYEDTVIPEIEKAIAQIEQVIQDSIRKLERVKKANKALLITLKAYNLKNTLEQSRFIETAKEMLGNLREPIEPLMSVVEDSTHLEDERAFATTNQHVKPIDDLMNEADDIIEELEELEEDSSDGEQDSSIKDDVKEKLKAALFKKLENRLEEIDNRLDKLLTEKMPEVEEEFAAATEKLKEIEEELTDKLNRLKGAAEIASNITEGMVGIVKDPKETLKILRDAIARIEEGQDVMSSIIKTSERIQKIFDDGFFLDGVDRIEGLQTDLQNFKSDVLGIVDRGHNAKQEAGRTLNQIEDKSRELDRSISDMLRFIDRELMPKYEDASGKASNALREGSKILAKAEAYFPSIYDLLKQVDDGVGKGKDGLKEANDVFPEAKEKITDIANRVRTLEEKGDLDQIIRLLKNDPSAESEFFSDPLVLNEHSLFPIPNYGSAMAPFFTALALWVGGLILVSSLIVDVPNKERYKSYETYFGRILTFWAIGIVQAFIVTVGNMVLLKTFVAHKLWFVLFGFFVSIVFVTIIYTLVSVFGNSGKVAAIILLVMQLGASGGTFPIQMTPEFFQKIHNFLPFTHALGLFRESIGGIIWSAVFTHTLWLIGYMLLFLFIGIKLKERINKSSDKFLEEARESEIIL